MSVERPYVLVTELLEEHAGNEQLLDGLLGSLARSHHHGPELRAGQRTLDVIAQAVVARIEPHASEVAGKCADVLGDRHLVVVEDDDHSRAEVSDVVERLEPHAPRHRTVADECAHGMVLARRVPRGSKAEGDRQRVRSVSGVEDVVRALGALGKPAYPAVLPQRMESLAPSRQELVNVGLVADIPHDLVGGAVKRKM